MINSSPANSTSEYHQLKDCSDEAPQVSRREAIGALAKTGAAALGLYGLAAFSFGAAENCRAEEAQGAAAKDRPLTMQASAVRYLDKHGHKVPIYSMELWLQNNPTGDLETLLKTDQNIELRMTVLRKIHPRDIEIYKTFTLMCLRHNLTQKEFSDLPQEEFAKLKAKTYEFANLSRQAKKDEQMTFSFSPDSVTIIHDNKIKGEFPDDPLFRNAVLMLWFPREPLDDGLKELRDTLLAGGKNSL